MPLHPAHQLNAARKRARTTRARNGIAATGPVPDLVALAEDRVGVPVVVTTLGDGVDGAYVVTAGAATIFLNASRPVVRQRFTLAHELGHHQLQHGTNVDDARDLVEGGGAQPIQERCANAFAAELLIPPDAARAWVDEFGAVTAVAELVRFAAAFGVSAAMAAIRVKTAGLAAAEQADALSAAIEEGEHLPLYARLGDVLELDDTLARVAADGGTRVPPAFARSVGALRV